MQTEKRAPTIVLDYKPDDRCKHGGPRLLNGLRISNAGSENSNLTKTCQGEMEWHRLQKAKLRSSFEVEGPISAARNSGRPLEGEAELAA
jgi:hypothetical protein